MRAVVQRVKKSSVNVNGKVFSKIEKGLCCLIGIKCGESIDDLKYIRDKIIKLRIFEDENGNLNKSVLDIGGELLLVSQFTLYGDGRKGNRPSFINAMKREEAQDLFNDFVEMFKKECNLNIKTGFFGSDMEVEIINDGPVTILLDSEKRL